MVDAADILQALNAPTGNRLEALKGDLTGKLSIRINDQWRILFRWTDAGANALITHVALASMKNEIDERLARFVTQGVAELREGLACLGRPAPGCGTPLAI